MSTAAMKSVFYYPVFWSAYAWFRLTGRTTRSGHRSLRRLYSATHGGFNRKVSKWLARGTRPAATAPAPGLLGSGDEATRAIEQALAGLRRDGFHVRHSYRTTHSVGKLLGEAARARARYAVILGDELAQGRVVVKDLDEGRQQEVTIEELAAALGRRT